jgi:SAM-dependent methyltransferase
MSLKPTATLDARARFAASAQHYDRHRPSYPPALLDWILDTTAKRPPARVADVGCGTGIATRLFAARGFDTVGIDPSEEMLAVAREAGGGPRYLRGEAAATSLPPGNVDLVVAAQCFHWFDTLPTLRELRRILRADGWCAAFWNLRAPTPVMNDYYELIRTHSTEYEILERQEAAPAALRAAIGADACEQIEIANAQTLDRDGLIGRAYSSSCVKHGVADKPAFEAALGTLFDRHQRKGAVEFAYRTVAVCWRRSAPPALHRPD